MAEDTDSTITLVANSGDERKLCDRCEQLELTVDKFIIRDTSTTVVRDTQRYEIKKPDASSFRLKSGSSKNNYALLRDLRANRDNCRLCELMCKAIEQYSHGKTNEMIACSLTWEVDGRQIESGSGMGYMNSTRRIRLSWCDTTGNRQEAYLVFVAPKDPLRPNSDARSKWEKEMHFLGREFGDQKEKHALIKSWLDLCIKGHSEVCLDTHGTEREFKELINETYFGVIDVADMQLKALPVKGGEPERYVALSYVWGSRPHDELRYKTTRANVMTHILHGGLETAWDKLPKTIQDAILLVSRLGERYLWVDSLCIVQDSDSSWQLNARAMHLVYGNAYFTICAADGDSSSGLCAVKPTLHGMHPSGPLHNAMADMSLNHDQKSKCDDNSQPMSAECAPGVRLMVTRPLEAVVNDSKWNKRAWTFQERILSRRCLVFAEGRVYFQCRSTGISQDIYADGKGRGWSLNRTNSPLRTLRELQQRPLWFYMKYVSMYTGRDLTKPGDILAAFEGISWLLERYMHAPSLFGMPTSHFDLALLWAPLTVLRRRRPEIAASLKKKICTQDVIGNCSCQSENESWGRKEFPSWAWCGWMGGTVEYQLEMLDGCLLNVREWLKYHTWIQWHIRDEKGHVRPLWEFSFRPSRHRRPQHPSSSRSYSRPGSFEDEDRWTGYPASSRDREVVVDRPRLRPEEVEPVQYGEAPVRARTPEVHFHDRPRGRSPVSSSTHTMRTREPHLPRPRYPGSPPNSHRSDDQVTDREYERVNKNSYLETGPGRRYEKSPPPNSRQNPSRSDHGHERVDNTDYIRKGSRSRRSSVEAIQYMEPIRDTEYNDSEWIAEARSQSPTCPYEDEYGRLIRAEIPKEMGPFYAILPDHPFGVIREKYYPRDPSTVQHMPTLQFWTWRTELHVTIREPSVRMTNKKTSGSGLCQCDIVDKEGDWCGSIVLDEEWIRESEGSLFQFIAISDAKAFSKEECPVWTYYIPKERDESEWDLYYVLLLERNSERGLWERAGLGKVFQAAFREKTWDEIKLG